MAAWTRLTLLVPLVLAHQGCGGSDSGGTGTGTGSTARVNSGLPPSTPIAGLSDAQAADLCNALASATGQAVPDREYCTFFAVADNLVISPDGNSTELDASACTTSAQQCLASGETMLDLDCTNPTASDLSGCDVTVSEFERCWNARLVQFSRIFGAVSCDRTPTAQDVADFDPDAVPAECEAVSTRCPDLLGTDSGSSGGNGTPSPTGCDDTCVDANDGFCDDGGPNSDTPICGLGTDCSDCGERTPPM